MLVEGIERFLELVAERDYQEDPAQADQGKPSVPPNEDKSTANELHKGYAEANKPKRPGGEKRVLVGQKEAPHVPGGP